MPGPNFARDVLNVMEGFNVDCSAPLASPVTFPSNWPTFVATCEFAGAVEAMTEHMMLGGRLTVEQRTTLIAKLMVYLVKSGNASPEGISLLQQFVVPIARVVGIWPGLITSKLSYGGILRIATKGQRSSFVPSEARRLVTCFDQYRLNAITSRAQLLDEDRWLRNGLAHPVDYAGTSQVQPDPGELYFEWMMRIGQIRLYSFADRRGPLTTIGISKDTLSYVMPKFREEHTGTEPYFGALIHALVFLARQNGGLYVEPCFSVSRTLVEGLRGHQNGLKYFRIRRPHYPYPQPTDHPFVADE